MAYCGRSISLSTSITYICDRCYIMRPISRKTLVYAERIVGLLRNVKEIHIRGIARYLNCHPVTVIRILDRYLDIFINVREINQFGFRAKLVSLKPDKNPNIQDIIDYIEAKKKIRG